jgi:hypothetical protein
MQTTAVTIPPDKGYFSSRGFNQRCRQDACGTGESPVPTEKTIPTDLKKDGSEFESRGPESGL